MSTAAENHSVQNNFIEFVYIAFLETDRKDKYKFKPIKLLLFDFCIHGVAPNACMDKTMKSESAQPDIALMGDEASEDHCNCEYTGKNPYNKELQ